MTEKPTTSDRKAIANRRNAQRSTGPKTEVGKRTAALNAIRHGLTAQKTVDSLDPVFVQIQSIILQEIEDPSAAQLLAQKILDYERNEAYQRQVAEHEHAGEEGFVDRRTVQQHLAESHVQSLMTGQFSSKLKKSGLNPAEKVEAKVLLDSLRFLIKVSHQKANQMVRDGAKKETQMRRYYKRASNQLIKAIKSATTRGKLVLKQN